MSVYVVGSYVQDHVWSCDQFPKAGETRVGSFSTGPGGKGFNQAVAAHRLGAPTTFFGSIGRDLLAATARAVAADVGLHVHFIETDAPTAAAAVWLDRSGENQIVVALGANLLMNAAAVEQALATAPAPAVMLVQLETDISGTIAALRTARAQSALTILNPAPAGTALCAEHLRLADVLTPNETEFQALARTVLGESIKPDVFTENAVLHRLCRALEAPRVVITLGESGVFVSVDDAVRTEGEAASYRIASPVVQARDTTGAGDAFSGALAACMSMGLAFPVAVRRATHAAALACERVGAATSMATTAELQARFPELFG